ncbi:MULTISPECIES: amidohydrolase family protein [Aerosakkonema]|uniref:amidohydrolase family protein n=1 Tax=Aerosakkonema TaxID=1246629 RepID=UPI0035B9B05C
MLKEYQIVDADCHVIEPIDIWENYIEPEFKSATPYKEQLLEKGLPQEQAIKIDFFSSPLKDIKIAGEKIYYKIPAPIWSQGIEQIIKFYTRYGVSNFNAESQVKAMKKMGTDISFLYPTVGLWLLAIDNMNPQLAGALTRAYNNWLRDFCSYDTQLLKGVGAINLHAPQEMVPELHRIAKFGWKAVFLRPNPVKGRLLSNPEYESFWAECERLEIAVSLHEGTHCRLPSTGADRFHTRFAMHACSHPMEQMMGMLALIEGGVLERYPKLKVGFLEAGCGWLPYWLWRLDEVEYKNLAWEVKDNVRMKPSEYFRRQCFVSLDPSEPYLNEIIQYIGSDNLIFGSDYPHIDHQPDVVNQAVELSERLPKKTVQNILWDNPMRFYGLN